MWERSHFIMVSPNHSSAIWQKIVNVNEWSSWDFNIVDSEYLDERTLTIQHRKFPLVRAKICKNVPERIFSIRVTLFCGAFERSYSLTDTGSGIKLGIKNKVSGILSPIWAMTVGRVIDSDTEEDLTLLSRIYY